jgi:serine/threonine protein kinase
MNKDFGGFELKEKIGSGGMASVYLAVQKSLSRPVVLKILYPHLAEDEKLVQRFEREARAAAMLRHENIVQVIDCGRFEDVSYIAMEFVEGMDLKKWLEALKDPNPGIAFSATYKLKEGFFADLMYTIMPKNQAMKPIISRQNLTSAGIFSQRI